MNPRQEQSTKIKAIALEIAVAAPVRFSKYGYYAYIPRRLIDNLRRAFEEYGVDWKTFKKSLESRHTKPKETPEP
jgi:hypothetical protein